MLKNLFNDDHTINTEGSLYIFSDGLDLPGNTEKKRSIPYKMNIADRLSAEDMIFLKEITIKNLLTATDCEFKNNIVAGGKITLTNSKTKDILVKNNDSQALQEIHIHGKSEIDGDITFEAGNGKVFLEEEAIINGKVNGGITIPLEGHNSVKLAT